MAHLSVPLPLPLKLALLASLVLLPLFVGRRRFGIAGGVAGLLVGLLLLGVCGWIYPVYPRLARSGPFVLLAGLSAGLALLPVGLAGRLARLGAMCPVALRLALTYGLPPLVAFGACEWVSQRLWEKGLIPTYLPVRTNVPPGTSDFRIFHVVQDELREADPVLLWRTLPVAPYNAQRFRGPLLATPRPAGTMRIMCYGDSNTDGPAEGGAWPEALHAQLARDSRGGERHEVVSAGVSGYSSYQGLTRFKQEVAVYAPDLAFVSFGWNDAAGVLGRPDKAFAPPPRPVTLLLRGLQHYLAYRSLRGYLSERQAAGLEARLEPRVSIDDYAANLKAFVDVGRAHGTRVVLLTRPHREPPEALIGLDDWRRHVPEYNRAILRLAEAQGIAAIDVQGLFAAQPGMFVDQCHFTREGHARLAGVLREWILAHPRGTP